MQDLLTHWTRHEAELRRWLLARSANSSEVDDILQDVFLKAMRSVQGPSVVVQPRAWLFEVTRNTLIDRLRSRHDGLPLPEGLDDIPVEEVLAHPLDGLAQACLPRVLAELHPDDREIIEYCDLKGMKQADFARLRHLTLPAVKSRLLRARKRMKDRMTTACQVTFDASGCVEDFVPRKPLE